jgi:hypothetical protein
MILPLEKQVCSIEAAKRLRELGFPQESLFYWTAHCLNESMFDIVSAETRKRTFNHEWPCISAYTVAELGELLPASIGDKDWLQWTKSLNGWKGICESLAYVKWSPENSIRQIFLQDVHKIHNHPYDKIEPKNFTMAETFAKMLIYLAENNLLTPRKAEHDI